MRFVDRRRRKYLHIFVFWAAAHLGITGYSVFNHVNTLPCVSLVIHCRELRSEFPINLAITVLNRRTPDPRYPQNDHSAGQQTTEAYVIEKCSGCTGEVYIGCTTTLAEANVGKLYHFSLEQPSLRGSFVRKWWGVSMFQGSYPIGAKQGMGKKRFRSLLCRTLWGLR